MTSPSPANADEAVARALVELARAIDHQASAIDALVQVIAEQHSLDGGDSTLPQTL